ncbi:MAG: hypothetical protein JWR38_4432 [Mucilaginibacter sp.]|nr:hypothetical protein [Mucilaginibacter sp.]
MQSFNCKPYKISPRSSFDDNFLFLPNTYGENTDHWLKELSFGFTLSFARLITTYGRFRQ